MLVQVISAIVIFAVPTNRDDTQVKPGDPVPSPEVIAEKTREGMKAFARDTRARAQARKISLPPGEVTVALQDMEWLREWPNADYFMQYLELSPDWTVTVRGGASPKVHANSKIDTSPRWIFGSLPRPTPDQVWSMPPEVLVAPGAGKTSIPRTVSYGDQAYSSLGVDASVVSLLVLELSADAGLAKMQADLENADATLKRFRAAVEAADKDIPGAVESAIVRLADRRPDLVGEAKMNVSSPDIQRQNIEAWINPGERGATALRVRDAKTGKKWNLLRSEPNLAQRMPWSNDATHLFQFSAKVAVMEAMTGWNDQHEVTFELWFTPDWPTRPERMLIEQTVTIPGWER